MQKVSGVLRVMNTAEGMGPMGIKSVAGLEAGSCVLSHEATEAVKDFYPDSMIAVTNAHVVGSQNKVMLNFHFNPLPFPAQVLKIDVQDDIAFLHVDPNSPEFKLALQGRDPPELIHASKIYNPTYQPHVVKCCAVGFPLGTTHQTISNGSITAMEVIDDNVVWYHDALINPGNSGGALLDSEGKLLGINTAIINPGSTISVAKPWTTVNSLLGYLEPDKKLTGFTADQMRQLVHMMETNMTPEELSIAWSANHGCEHTSCGISCGHQNFSQWFNDHCYNKPRSHCMLKDISAKLEVGGHVHAHEGWMECKASCGSCGKGSKRVYPTEKIMFQPFFKVSTTVPILDNLQTHFPAASGGYGVLVSKVGDHERAMGLERGDLLVGINNRKIDNYGNFMDTKMPYFTAFKDHPGKLQTLNIARRGEPKLSSVYYGYDRIDPQYLPKIHDPSLYTQREMIQIGGLTITQMDSDMAKEHPEYLKEKVNDVVGVVVNVQPNCAEWVIQQIAPGSLLTEVNHTKLQNSITESLKGAHTLTFVGKDGTSIDKLV